MVLSPDLSLGAAGLEVCFKVTNSCLYPAHRLAHIRDFYRQFAHPGTLQDTVSIGE